MSPNLYNPYTVLDDRILWYDGDSSYTTKALECKILSGDINWTKNYVIDPEDYSVSKINQLDDEVNLTTKESIVIPDDSYDWRIPHKYMELDIEKHIYALLLREFNKHDFNLIEENIRIDRVREEFNLWTEGNMINLLRTLIYLIDIFELNDIVWGTGRGSSCCSYILYLIGVHDVDSIKYELDITDFFRT